MTRPPFRKGFRRGASDAHAGSVPENRDAATIARDDQAERRTRTRQARRTAQRQASSTLASKRRARRRGGISASTGRPRTAPVLASVNEGNATRPLSGAGSVTGGTSSGSGKHRRLAHPVSGSSPIGPRVRANERAPVKALGSARHRLSRPFEQRAENLGGLGDRRNRNLLPLHSCHSRAPNLASSGNFTIRASRMRLNGHHRCAHHEQLRRPVPLCLATEQTIASRRGRASPCKNDGAL